MSTEYLRHMLDMVSSTTGVSPFSEEFVWGAQHRKARFGAFLSSNGRITLLDALLRAELSDEERLRMFPTPLDLGRHDKLESSQITYQAIADTVAQQLTLDSAGFDERYVKQTAETITELVGFPFSNYRDCDPELAARVLKLFVYLKKTQGPGVLGMLKPPGGKKRPSLELTNPYAQGVSDERRLLYSDIKSYLSARIPLDRLAEIDTCFDRLRPELGSFLGLVMRQVQDAPQPNGRYVTVDDACERLRQAADVYGTLLAPLSAVQKVFLPLDEQLYIHIRSLEFLHYSEFMRQLRCKELIRADVRPAVQKFHGSKVKARYQDLQEETEAYMPLLRVVEYAFDQAIAPDQFRRVILTGSHVLRHYLQVRTIDPEASADFRLVAAILCFAMDLETNRVPQFKPHIHGQSNISGSIMGAMRSGVNERHEEFERICSECVDWYQAALTDQLEMHSACHDLMELFEQIVAGLCRSHNTEFIASFLDQLSTPGFSSAWLAR